MSLYVQRCLAMQVLPGGGAAMTPSSAGFWQVLHDFSDALPYNIMAAGNGNSSTGEVTIAASGSQVLRLPENYVNTQYLGILLSASASVKVAIASPDHTTGTQLLKAGTASDEEAFFSSQDTVNSITVTNLSGSATVTVRYFLWTYPADLTDPGSWRTGSQTTGTL